MRGALLGSLVLLAACSSTTVVTTAPATISPDTDARICEFAFTPPWNDGAMTALTRDPSTPIQEQARTTQDAWDNGEDSRAVTEWHTLSGMCVDAGF